MKNGIDKVLTLEEQAQIVAALERGFAPRTPSAADIQRGLEWACKVKLNLVLLEQVLANRLDMTFAGEDPSFAERPPVEF